MLYYKGGQITKGDNIMTVHTIYNDDIDYSELSAEDMDYYDSDYFNDELINLKVPTEEQIIAIADMGLWNGRKQGYRVCNRLLSECLTVGNKDYNHLYYDGFNVRKTTKHPDGTNYILFREFKSGLSDASKENFINKIYSGEPIDNATLNRYTRSLRRYVKKVYGW